MGILLGVRVSGESGGRPACRRPTEGIMHCGRSADKGVLVERHDTGERARPSAPASRGSTRR